MSGFEIVGTILAVYPLVGGAVNVYKATKSGRAVAALTRRLRTEAVIYRQFVHNLLAPNVSEEEIDKLVGHETPDLNRWEDVTLHQKVRQRLGNERADLVLEILSDVDKLLRALSTEFSNISHGIEVLDKLRSGLRVARYNLPKSSVQHRLSQLSILNGDLGRLLDNQPLGPGRKGKGDLHLPTHFLLRDCREAVELYELIRKSYACDCDEPHIANFGLHCPSHDALLTLPDSKNPKWTFELVFPPEKRRASSHSDLIIAGSTSGRIAASDTAIIEDELDEEVPQAERPTNEPLSASSEVPPNRERTRSISISVESQNGQDDEHSFIQDLCSFMEKLDTDIQVSDSYLGFTGRTNKSYKLCINSGDVTTPGHIVCLEELLKPSHRSARLRKVRMQLALRLSSAILQFCLTPWIENSWSWKDFAVLSVEEEQNEDLSQLFVTRRFYSARASAKFEPTPLGINTLWSWYDEPILTKLGFALIELALGRSLQEIRDEQSLGLGVIDQELDFDSLNLQTANTLLKSGRIASEESQGYEDVVKACIKHQYPDTRNPGIKGLDSTDDSFFDNVEESIIGPLYAECAKSWGLS